MTAQFAEKLHYQGEDVAMLTNPLSQYFALGGSRPPISANCTALWRGYVGSWEFISNRLYLVGLTGELEGGEAATLASVFPDYPNRVFAHWYSGTIRIPRGKLLRYVHMGYGSTYEADLLLDVERGVIVKSQLCSNEPPEDEEHAG